MVQQRLLKDKITLNYRSLLILWCSTAVIYAVVKMAIGKFNNYKIFENVYFHAREGIGLYGDHFAEYYDSNHYGIIFSAIIAPFALLPQWIGVILWIIANTMLLFYAIKKLPLNFSQKRFIYLFSFIELLTAQSMQQFNISVAAFIILTFVWIEEKKDFWAAFLIILGTLVKLYPIVGLAFFFFSKNKVKFILSLMFWAVVLFCLPILYTPGPEYVVSQYFDWFERLQIKNEINKFAIPQNISLLGIVRKISGNGDYSDLWLLVPGVIMFLIPYLRIKDYSKLSFRMSFLANVLLFMVLFSTGSEGSGYITAMIGIALWYIVSPSKNKKSQFLFMMVAMIIVALCSTEIVPKTIRVNFITKYVIKAWPCTVAWLILMYEMIFSKYENKLYTPTMYENYYTEKEIEEEICYNV